MPLERDRIVASQQLVIDVFKGFRDELMLSYGKIEYTRKQDKSQVTKLDIKVEQTLRDRLAELYPEFGFQGEETGKSGNIDDFWLVDPIDGTSSFIRGLSVCTNMAALIHNGQSVAAVIYDFVNDILYTAIKGEGSYENGHRMRVNTNRLAGSLFVYSMSGHKFNELRSTMTRSGMQCYYPVGAAGHAYAMVAKGKIDGVATLNTKTGVHDNAPGLLLVSEAGGEIISFDGRDDIYVHEFVVGTPTVVGIVAQHQDEFETLIGR